MSSPTAIREMLSRRFPRGKYPPQFWLMFWGMLISTLGSSMVWPFLFIYVTETLGLPLTAAASLMTINSIIQTGAAFVAGPVIDRAGRKWIMVISLIGLGCVYVFYTQASTYAAIAVLMALTGLFNPLYRVGGDAMLADLIPPEERSDAYALLRTSNNAGIAIGPAIGGFAAALSYNVAFLGAAAGLSVYAILLAIFARETLPRLAASTQHSAQDLAPAVPDPAAPPAPARVELAPQPSPSPAARKRDLLGGYALIFADRPFLAFVAAFTLNQVCAALIWVMLAAYAKHNFGVLENQYGFIPVTNALIVVFLQAAVTLRTKRLAPLPVLALGSLIYGVAAASVALGHSFLAFWASMVIFSLGELLLMPTATTFTANLAPADMRGRYMSVFGLTWGVAMGIGPLFGGVLSDALGPTAPWLMGGIAGLTAALMFTLQARHARAASLPGARSH
jgi:MFS family permease